MSKQKAVALEVSPHELRPNSWNTNMVGPEMEQRIQASIERFEGLFKPIIVREVAGIAGYEILGGEHRWIVAKKTMMKTVPIWNLGPIDEKTAKEISIADNARYGADDTLALAELLKSLGTEEELQAYLPYGEIELQSIFSSEDIALDDLEVENSKIDDEDPEPAMPKAPKTHTMIRFKVLNEDAEKITALINETQKSYGYTTEDQATNAGDALVHLLNGSGLR